jgi:hypothetical protein
MLNKEWRKCRKHIICFSKTSNNQWNFKTIPGTSPVSCCFVVAMVNPQTGILDAIEFKGV